MVNDTVTDYVQFTAVMQVLVDGIAACENHAVQQNDIADFQFANVGFRQRRFQPDDVRRGKRELRHRFFMLEFVRALVQPFGHVSIQVESNAAPPICPAHIGDRDEE